MAEVKSAPKVAVIYYSMYGHIAKLAESVAAGAKAAGAEVTIYRVPETLPEEVLKAMHAGPKNEKHPIAKPDDLVDKDAIIFGIPTRYGNAAAQFRSFWDSTGALWQKGALVGKLASVFFSTGTQGGGQETTALTSYVSFAHHGMIIVPIGYSDKRLFSMTETHGGSAYGAGTFSGDGSRQPTEMELGIAEHQGKLVAGYAAKFKKGSQ